MEKITRVIPNKPFWDFNFRQIWDYKHLVYYLVHRDMVVMYKQTIMGPIHLFLRPFVMTVVFQLIFHKMVGVETDGISPFLFYFVNNSVWMFFSQTFTQIGGVFTQGKTLMEKVFFPRLILPFSYVFGGVVRLLIQFFFLLPILLWYYFFFGYNPVSWNLCLLPVAILQTIVIAMGFGLLFAIITLKYRDLKNFSTTLIQGFLYLSPVIYPISSIPDQYRFVAAFNPMFSNLELYRLSIFGTSAAEIQVHYIGFGIASFVILFVSFSFNVIQRKFIDIV